MRKRNLVNDVRLPYKRVLRIVREVRLTHRSWFRDRWRLTLELECGHQALLDTKEPAWYRKPDAQAPCVVCATEAAGSAGRPLP